MVLGVLILPPVRGASKQGGAPPNPVKGGKIAFGIGCGGQNNRPARGLRYNSGAELTATPTAAETAPPQQQKADNVRRLRKAEASAGTAAGNAVACVGRGASRAQRATSAEQRERIT